MDPTEPTQQQNSKKRIATDPPEAPQSPHPSPHPPLANPISPSPEILKIRDQKARRVVVPSPFRPKDPKRSTWHSVIPKEYFLQLDNWLGIEITATKPLTKECKIKKKSEQSDRLELIGKAVEDFRIDSDFEKEPRTIRIDKVASAQIYGLAITERLNAVEDEWLSLESVNFIFETNTTFDHLNLLTPGSSFVFLEGIPYKFGGFTLNDQVLLEGVQGTCTLAEIHESLAKDQILRDSSLQLPHLQMSDGADTELHAVFIKLWEKLWNQKVRGIPTAAFLVRLHFRHGYRIMIVGGTPRDLLQELQSKSKESSSKDIDLVVAAPYTELHQALSDFLSERNIPTECLRAGDKEKQFGQMKVIKQEGEPEDLDIALFKAGKLPCGDYFFGFSIKLDAQSRDLSRNALYIDPFEATLYDPTGHGRTDAQANHSRLAHPPSFETDYGGQIRLWMKSKGFEMPNPEEFEDIFIASLRTTSDNVKLQVLLKLQSKLFKGKSLQQAASNYQKFKHWKEIVTFIERIDERAVLTQRGEDGKYLVSNQRPLLALIRDARELLRLERETESC